MNVKHTFYYLAIYFCTFCGFDMQSHASFSDLPFEMQVEVASHFTYEARQSFRCVCLNSSIILDSANCLRHFRSKERWYETRLSPKRDTTNADIECFLANSFVSFHGNTRWTRGEFDKLYEQELVHVWNLRPRFDSDGSSMGDKLPDFFFHALDYLECMFISDKTWLLRPRFLRELYSVASEREELERVNQWIVEKIHPFCNSPSSAFNNKKTLNDVKIALFIYEALGNKIISLMHLTTHIKRPDHWLGCQFYRFILEKATDYPEYPNLPGVLLYDNQYHLKRYFLELPMKNKIFIKGILESILSIYADENSEVVRNSLYALELLEARPS